MKNLKIFRINEIPNKRILGRNVKDVYTKKSADLFWNGSGIEVEYQGSQLWACFDSRYDEFENWIAVFINGRITARTMLPRGRHWICLCRGFTADTVNTIRVINDVQPMPDDKNHLLTLRALACDKGGKFLNLPPKSMNIEFIGDSLTTGEGLYGAVKETQWLSAFMSVHKTYAYLAASKLNADYRIMSNGGWGIVAGYDNSPYRVIPPHYKNICSLVQSPLYKKRGGCRLNDFAAWSADVVVVNLGTNDSGGFNAPPYFDAITGKTYKLHLGADGMAEPEDGAYVIRQTAAFIKVIRECNPRAKIIWAIGMMDIPAVKPLLQEGIKAYKAAACDEDVYWFEFDSMAMEKSEEDKGSRFHPGELVHKCGAEKLCNFIESILR